MNILTLGNGFISNHLPYNKILDRVEINENYISNILDNYKPDILINAIGFGGHPNIDQCELEKEKTTMTNTVLPTLLAYACQKKNIHLIHIGSGCIFFGNSPNIKFFANLSNDSVRVDYGWQETDHANPLSFYSKTKYATDLNISNLPNVTILRIRMPISTQNHPRNLINKLINYSKVIDAPNSMTFMDDFVKCVDWIAQNNKTGIYHVTNPQPLSAVEIMTEYQKYNKSHKFEIINEKELNNITLAKRSNCILDTRKLSDAGFSMSLSGDAIKEYIKKYCLEKNV